MKRVPFVIILSMLLAALSLSAYAADTTANAHSPAATTAAPATDSITPGTTITKANWQQFKQFMSDGMVALFEGKYFWKMPAGVEIEVGPTVNHPLPKDYVAATEKYASQVRIKELPTGGLSLENYRGGIPFPNAAEPHKGWKLLANMWYRYIPYLVVDTSGTGCSLDSTGSADCQVYIGVKRQLAYNTDTDAPAEPAGPDARYFTEWFMTLEPEQDRYLTYLTVNYADPEKPEAAYVFLPSLRRSQPISNAARCSESGGLDQTYEDFHNGLDTNLTEMNVENIGHRKMIALVDVTPPTAPFPGDTLMPLAFPTPKWGKWQVRDVDVLGLTKIPSKAGSYCYGKRVIYTDSAYGFPLWEDMWDTKNQPWKFAALFPLAVDVPGVGVVDTAALDVEVWWDIQRNHATFVSEPAQGHAYYINGQAPKEYHDDNRYATPAGLNLIMR
jgi:Protein of unknown function (DUF1329)